MAGIKATQIKKEKKEGKVKMVVVEKKQYVKPTNADEALVVLKGLTTEIYNRVKGRGLGLIEKFFPAETNRAEQQMARDQYLLMLSGIMSSITKKIDDVVEVLEK